MEAKVSSKYEEPRAHELRRRYVAAFGGEELPAPVERIAEDLLGLRFEVAPLAHLSGMLVPSERRIVLNADEDVVGRRRFTVAHELGHWICHCIDRKPAPVYCRATDLTADADRTTEREANVFAAELLMPEDAVRNASGSLDEVASRFGVSAEAMAWRLYSFGLGPAPRREEAGP